jgi:hypothetical protein
MNTLLLMMFDKKGQKRITDSSGVKPTKLLSFAKWTFFSFFATKHHFIVDFFLLQTLKFNNKNKKNEEIKDWLDRLL